MKLDNIQRASQEQFARQSHHYGRGHILENTEDIERALGHIQLPARAQALDVATGGGHTGLFFASLGHDVTVSDLAEPMLKRTAETAQARGLRLTTAQHSAESLPYPDASFDLVTCRIAPHHFSSPRDFVRESARVLRKDGHFLLIDGTVEDNQVEAEGWMHAVEKLRDPSHNRLLTPGEWRRLCTEAGLHVCHAEVARLKQPDLNWYFEAAGTTPENRSKVLDLVAHAPESARRLFDLGQEDGKIVWWWQRLTLVAQKRA
jgi:SAM-dependent methyltransferase